MSLFFIFSVSRIWIKLYRQLHSGSIILSPIFMQIVQDVRSFFFPFYMKAIGS